MCCLADAGLPPLHLRISGPTYRQINYLRNLQRSPRALKKTTCWQVYPERHAAEEAKIDAQIPQTAKVDRKVATVKVEYDGEPKFKTIEGTSLQLAENSNITVLKDASGKYYAVDNGIWFVSSATTGPWVVADERPKDVDKIPASSEAYNTKYVYVYETTPEYVYVGYTPGYMGCYVYGPTIVYGTGWYYPPWYGYYYYPAPVTWGYGFYYNPWYGWGVGIWVGFWGGYGGWFGPPLYRPPYVSHHGGYYGNGGNRPGNGGNRPGNGNHVEHHGGNNLYNNKPGVSTRESNRGNTAGMNRPSAGTNDRPGARPAGGTNNVFTDRDGNTFQKDSKGNWSQRNNQSNRWTPMDPNNNKSREMNRDLSKPRQGKQRQHKSAQQNYQPSRGNYGGGGGMRGGGGRRRQGSLPWLK